MPSQNEQNAKPESPVARTMRLAKVAKDSIDQLVTKMGSDPNYFGRPSIELVIQNGAIETISVTENKRYK